MFGFRKAIGQLKKPGLHPELWSLLNTKGQQQEI